MAKFLSLNSSVAVGFALLVYSTTLHSQSNLGAQSIDIGESRLFPTIGLEFITNDNALRRSTNELDNRGVILHPSLTWTADKRLTKVNAAYQGSFASFEESATDFDDHLFRGTLDTEFSSRSRLFAGVSLELTHNPLGTEFTRFAPEFLDQTEIRNLQLQLRHRYGTKNARANVISAISVLNREFLNNSLLTDTASFTRVTPLVGISTRLSGKTRAEIRLRGNSTDFDADIRQDRNELGLVAGVSIEASEKSGGSFFLGATRASFDGTRDSQTEFLVAIDAFLSTSRLSRIDLSLERDFFDGAGAGADTGNQAVSTRFEAQWNYQWSDRLAHVLGFELDNLSRNCPAESEVDSGIAFSLNLSLRRWLAAGLKIQQNQRDSETCPNQAQALDLDFQQRQISLTLTGSL